MDSYSGSEPRLFISFHLGNESNGQPPRRGADDEKMDSNDSFVTAIATTENQPAVNASIRDSGEGDSGSTVRVGAAETSHDNPETGATVENLLSQRTCLRTIPNKTLEGLPRFRLRPVKLPFL